MLASSNIMAVRPPFSGRYGALHCQYTAKKHQPDVMLLGRIIQCCAGHIAQGCQQH